MIEKYKKDSSTIGFWAEADQYGCFSNFYPCTFVWKGLKFNCSEQAFMWSKAMFFKDTETAEKIMQEVEPKKIKKLGRLVKNFDDNKWAEVRYNYMLDINKEKYRQNIELRNTLINTGYTKIVEDSPFDYIWGIGKDGSGQNLLGKVLMEVREYFQKNDK